jgi:hypothetical protein
MLGATDWAGIAAVIAAVGSAAATVIAAIATAKVGQVHKEVKNPNGSTTGRAVEEVHAALSTPPTVEGTVATVVADTQQAVQEIKTALDNKGGEPPHAAGAVPPASGGW